MDLNVLMRDQARAGLQVQLDTAVTNGDAETARKVADDIAKLAVSTAPKAPAFGDVEIVAQLDTKAPWYGTDPEKSALAVQFGKTMNPRKFATAEAFADAIIKAVDNKFKPPVVEPKGEEGEEGDGTDEGEEGEEAPAAAAKPKRKTDGPGEGDVLGRGVARAKSGPWTKLADAPADVQKEIKRQADRFVSSTAPKEQREKFVTKALESHYVQHQRKGKK